MPRKTATPAERIAKIKADAPLAANAVQALLRAIESGDQENLADAAKFLEAFGCYARRTDLPAPAPAAIPAAASQTVKVYGPNLADQSKGSFHVHAEGCGVKVRTLGGGFDEHPMVFEASSKTEVADETYADHIGEGSMEPGEGLSDHHFCPCVKLPVR